jgi:hypothetical protein
MCGPGACPSSPCTRYWWKETRPPPPFPWTPSHCATWSTASRRGTGAVSGLRKLQAVPTRQVSPINKWLHISRAAAICAAFPFLPRPHSAPSASGEQPDSGMCPWALAGSVVRFGRADVRRHTTIRDTLSCCLCHPPVVIEEGLEPGAMRDTLVAAVKVPYLEQGIALASSNT